MILSEPDPITIRSRDVCTQSFIAVVWQACLLSTCFLFLIYSCPMGNPLFLFFHSLPLFPLTFLHLHQEDWSGTEDGAILGYISVSSVSLVIQFCTGTHLCIFVMRPPHITPHSPGQSDPELLNPELWQDRIR